MADKKSESTVSIRISGETRERIEYLAGLLGMSFDEMAEKLLADQAEAEAGLQRGPYLRKYMYR
jgi:hypothetical protein